MLFGIVSVTEETVQHWIENEKSVITGKDVHYPVADWRTTYFLLYYMVLYSRKIHSWFFVYRDNLTVGVKAQEAVSSFKHYLSKSG